jgi:hypothetical protein
MIDYTTLSLADQALLTRVDVATHFEAFTYIKGKDGRSFKPTCNATQRKMFAAYQWCQLNNQPCKLIVLKVRQSGGSETSAELVYHHSRRYNLGGFMMADIDAHTTKIWELFTAKTLPGGDEYGLLWGNKLVADSEKATLTFKDTNGRMGKAMWDRATAGSSTAGASGTRSIAWFSESARGAYRGSNVIQNALNSIDSKLPQTLIIAESTAEGTATGFHFQTFNAAVAIEDRMAGKYGNGWLQIFVAWHEVDEYKLEREPKYEAYFNDLDPQWVTFNDAEEAGRIRFGWTPEQVAWRRWKIASDLGGDILTFMRDFPSTAEEAWQSSGEKKFSQTAVAKMMKLGQVLWEKTLRNEPGAPRLGSLINGPGGIIWSSLRDEAWLWCAEEPLYGCRYLLVVDPASERQVAGTDNRDAHAVGVFRRWYTDEHGVTHPSELVACVYVPGGCRWDMDVLGSRIGIISKWYGRCMVVPELNRPEILPFLQASDCLIYKRPAPPDAENPSMRREVLGYITDRRTRGQWVEAATVGIRESEMWCKFLPAIREFDTFIKNDDGKAEAAPGAHDDFVTMYGIGCQCIDGATTRALPIVRQPNYRPHQGQSGGMGLRKGSAALG